MDVKEAVKTALQYVTDLFANEQLSNVGLEEVVFDEAANAWDVTVGFSRPWDHPKPGPFGGLITSGPHRQYKIVRVKATTGQVESVRIREEK